MPKPNPRNNKGGQKRNRRPNDSKSSTPRGANKRVNKSTSQPEGEGGFAKPKRAFGSKKASPKSNKPYRTTDQTATDGHAKPNKFSRANQTEPTANTEGNKEGYKTKKGPKRAQNQRPGYERTQNAPKFFAKKTNPDNTKQSTRLNKYLAHAGVASRRDADLLITEGSVKVNGVVVKQMGYQVMPGDEVTYKNRKLRPEKPVYVLMNKPKDHVTTTKDPEGRRSVMDIIGDNVPERIYPVGRLDRNTTGLLLITNDGDLAKKLAHPSSEIGKIYEVTLNNPFAEDDFQKVLDTVTLEDGPVPVDDLQYTNSDKTKLGIEIHVGRNRIVRRLFEHLGYKVTNLDRVIYAGLTKKNLARGQWRYLSEKEVVQLKYFTGKSNKGGKWS